MDPLLNIAENPAWLEKGKYLFSQPCTFMLSAAKMAQLPQDTLPEIAFVGRSNVGKSSMINALTNRNSLAKTSVTPGRTQLLNFFNLNDQIIMVDMPGYGYAQAPHEIIRKWTTLIHQYLLGRPTLKRVYVLIDSRHGIKPSDEALFKILDEAAVSYEVVLTKTDKIKETEKHAVYQSTLDKLKKHVAAYPHVLCTSSRTFQGIDGVKAEIAALAVPR